MARRPLAVPLGALLVWCVTSATAQSPSGDYTQWRGQNRDGSAVAFSVPSSWPEQLTRRWKTSVGEGYGTPLVVGDLVYTFTRSDGNEVMTALGARTGEIAWQTRSSAPFAPAYNARAHGAGPKSTPVFHNGKLYALGIKGGFTAFDALTGKVLWQKNAPSQQPEYGAASSPIAHQDMVIVHPGSYEPLTAFDANTGEVKWRSGDQGAFASPIMADLAGTQQLVTVTQRAIAGISPSDGKGLWQYPWPRDISAITPVQYGDTIIVGSQNESVKALRVTRRGNGFSVSLAWETRDVGLYISNPVIVGDVLFGLSRRASGQFFALDAKTGAALWLGLAREAGQSAVAKAGNLLFLMNDNAELIVAGADRSGIQPIKRYTVADSAVWAQPAISGNRIFVKDTTSLALWTVN